MNTETCPEIDPELELEFEIEAQKISGKCCPEIVKTACRYEGKLYKPREKWKSLKDSCITETCVNGPNITKHKEVEVCSKQCAQVRISFTHLARIYHLNSLGIVVDIILFYFQGMVISRTRRWYMLWEM